MKAFLLPLACALAVLPLARAQAPDPHTHAMVHVFRTGSHGNAIQVLADGQPILKLSDHEIVSFALMAGQHELSASYAHQQPTLTMTLQSGQEYFVDLAMDARHSALLTGAAEGAIALTLTQQNSAPEGLHTVQLSPDDLSTILSQTTYGRHPESETAAVAAPDPPTPVAPAPAAMPAAPASSSIPAVVAAPAIAQQSYRVKYAGGTVADATVGRELQLRISSAAVDLGSMRIPSAAVTGITLSQDKHHRIGTGIAISMVTLGAGVPVMFSKSTKDFIQITWNNDGQAGGAAFQADKNEYRGILAALEGVTGKTATMPAEK